MHFGVCQLGEAYGFVIVAQCTHYLEVLTYSSFASTTMHGFGVYRQTVAALSF